ncbi:hypothetical protein KPL78_13875 [Roseomonas sp. HJA6]|uniref:Zorya protein ZorC EH domain-containing protein n=1 Tax=Roseomonas alba TaxID=2846776 RepID=A0ABS7A9V4_9PROT|nr:EH signature domain-containing protein [Neoroseomonas alba]MBW6398948.1 hypothetical protein [Neoroseomonas alba]
MSHARDALGRLKAGITLVPRAFDQLSKSPSQRAAAQLETMFQGIRIPSATDLEALRKRMQAVFTGGDKVPITRRELRNAVWILWNGSPQGAAIPGLMEAMIGAASASPRLIRAMIEAWLRDYAADSGVAREGGLAIRRLLRASQDALLQRWQEADRDFAIFDASKGVPRIAKALLSGRQEVGQIWMAIGLDDSFRATGGYMRAVLSELLAMLPAVLRGSDARVMLDRSLAVLAPDDKLRFGQEMRGAVGRGLLGAWLDAGRAPDAALRDPVRDFLLRHLGDPRTRAPNWTPVGDTATALMRRWLARASLDAFFDLIDEYALDHQWRYRKAFWSAYLERGAIEDAWLALGYRVGSAARAVRDLAGAHGRLEGGGVQGNQSVLLMHIGPLVVCEWSHNGKLRAWPRDWANAPALHRQTYARDDLVSKGLPFPPSPETGVGGSADGMGLVHRGSDNGVWQGSAAELIARKARITLTRSNWMPT